MAIITIGQLGAALLAANFVARPILDVAIKGASGKFNLYTRKNSDGTSDNVTIPRGNHKNAERHDVAVVAKALGLTPTELIKTLSVFIAFLSAVHIFTGGLTVEPSLSLA